MSGNYADVSALSVKVCSADVKFLAKLVGEAVGTSQLVASQYCTQPAALTLRRRRQLKVHKK